MNIPAYGAGGEFAYNLIKCCQYPILPIISPNNQLETGNIGTGNISTLATFSTFIPMNISTHGTGGVLTYNFDGVKKINMILCTILFHPVRTTTKNQWALGNFHAPLPLSFFGDQIMTMWSNNESMGKGC